MRALCAAAVAAGAALVAACVSPDYPEGLACSAEGTCPPGQACNADGVCRSTGGGGTDVRPEDNVDSGAGMLGDIDAASPVAAFGFEPAELFDAVAPARCLSLGALDEDMILNDLAVGGEQGIQLYRSDSDGLTEQTFLQTDAPVLAVRFGAQEGGNVAVAAVTTGASASPTLRVWADASSPSQFADHPIATGFGPRTPINTGLVVADFDGNGQLDAAVYVASDPPEIAVFLNDGANMTPAPTVSLVGTEPATGDALVPAALSGDMIGMLAADGRGRVMLLFNAGGGSFSVPLANGVDVGFSQINAITGGDFDGDGDPDPIITGDSGVARIVENEPASVTFNVVEVGAAAGIRGDAVSLAAGDFNGDGLDDLVVDQRILLHSGGSLEDFDHVGDLKVPSGSVNQTAILDVNDDGRPDIAYVTDQGLHVMKQQQN